MGKYLDIARRFEARQQTEQAEATQQRMPVHSIPDPSPWSCTYCSQPLTIDEVCRSLDGERMLTLWRCDPCEVAGVTPDAIQKPPTVWVKMIKQ